MPNVAASKDAGSSKLDLLILIWAILEGAKGLSLNNPGGSDSIDRITHVGELYSDAAFLRISNLHQNMEIILS